MGMFVTTLKIEAPRALQRRQSSSRVRMMALVSAHWACLAPVHAMAGQSARLVYSRTAEASRCADEKELRQAVARRLGYDPFVAVSMNTIVAELRGDGEGLRARVYVIHDGNSAGGTRELTAPTRNCTELIAAVALAMSIAVDPDALDRAEPEPVPTVASATSTEYPPEVEPHGDELAVAKDKPAQTSAPRAATTNSKNTPASHSSVRGVSPREPGQAVALSAGIAASGATGLAPAPVFGLALNAAARMHNWALSFEPEATLPSTSSTTASGASVRAWSLGGTVSAGYCLGQLYAGALFDAVVFSARGQNVDHPNVRRPVFGSTGLRMGYAMKLTEHITLMPRLDGLLALSRMTLLLNHEDAYQTPSVFGRLGVSLDYGF